MAEDYCTQFDTMFESNKEGVFPLDNRKLKKIAKWFNTHKKILSLHTTELLHNIKFRKHNTEERKAWNVNLLSRVFAIALETKKQLKEKIIQDSPL